MMICEIIFITICVSPALYMFAQISASNRLDREAIEKELG